jgi:Fic/DOC family
MIESITPVPDTDRLLEEHAVSLAMAREDIGILQKSKLNMRELRRPSSLCHPLVEHFKVMGGSVSFNQSHFDDEIAILATLSTTINSPTTSLIEASMFRMSPAAGLIRTYNMHTAPDINGNSIQFPPPGQIRKQLREIDRLIDQVYAKSAVLCGVVASTLWANLHPFNDGNGRSSRVMFNYLANNRKEPFAIIPIKRLDVASGGAITLSQQEVFRLGRWDRLVLAYCEAVAETKSCCQSS